VGPAAFLQRAWGGSGPTTGTVLARQYLHAAGRDDACSCPSRFRRCLGREQGLLPVFPVGPPSCSLPSALQTLAQAPCPGLIQTTARSTWVNAGRCHIRSLEEKRCRGWLTDPPASKTPPAQPRSCPQQPRKLKPLIWFCTSPSQPAQRFTGLLAGGEMSTERGTGCAFPAPSLPTELNPEPKCAPDPGAGAAPALELLRVQGAGAEQLRHRRLPRERQRRREQDPSPQLGLLCPLCPRPHEEPGLGPRCLSDISAPSWPAAGQEPQPLRRLKPPPCSRLSLPFPPSPVTNHDRQPLHDGVCSHGVSSSKKPR